MKTGRSMSLPFQKGLASVSPAWMRAVRRRKLCERRCIRSGESKRLSLSRGSSTGYGHEFTNRSKKMYSESQSRKAERHPPRDCTVRLRGAGVRPKVTSGSDLNDFSSAPRARGLIRPSAAERGRSADGSGKKSLHPWPFKNRPTHSLAV